MLFGKYHIVIFTEGRSGSRNLRMRGWFGFIACVLVLALVACNVWLLRSWLETRHLGDDLRNADKTIEEQRRQLVNLVERISVVGRDLERVQSFDSKLRIMMNMEKDPTEAGSIGDRPGDFSRTYLPLHRQELAARKMLEFLTRLSESVRLEEVRQQDLLLALRENRDALSSMPTIWPVVGFVSSSFGWRSAPFGGRGQFHKGLDITNRIGTPIMAPAQGMVTLSGRDGAYGFSVEINHGSGIVTKYGHMPASARAFLQGSMVRSTRSLTSDSSLARPILMSMPVETPPYADVANAVGAALTLPTDALELYADTGRCVLTIPALELTERIGKGYSLSEARQRASAMLRERLEAAGVSGARVEVTEADIFATLDDAGFGSKDIRVVCQVVPGLSASMKIM